VYVNDGKNIYEFNIKTGTQRTLTTMDPASKSHMTSGLALSLDEKKLYYVITLADIGGSDYVNDFYEYNVETGVRTKLMNLKAALGVGAKISGSHATASNGKIYYVFRPNSNAGIIEIDVSSRICCRSAKRHSRYSCHSIAERSFPLWRSRYSCQVLGKRHCRYVCRGRHNREVIALSAEMVPVPSGRATNHGASRSLKKGRF
jgi:hypothetical protein